MSDQWVSPSPLQALENSFGLLSMGPGPPRLGVSEVPGMAGCRLAPAELASALSEAPPTVHDHLWRAVVRQARSTGATWRVIAAGLTLPHLYGVVAQWSRQHTVSRDDLAADVLAEVLSCLRHMDLTPPHIYARLCLAAERVAHRHVERRVSIAIQANTPTLINEILDAH